VPHPAPDTSLPARLFPLALAITTLNCAVHTHNGLYSRPAVALLLISLTLFAHAALIPATLRIPPSILRGLVAALVLLQSTLLLTAAPLNDILSPPNVWIYYACNALVATGALILVLTQRTRLALAIALTGVTLNGLWTIHTNPSPHIDVYLYQQLSSQALLQGHNPYTLTFPNPYSPTENWVFAPGSVTPDRILFGFPYMPLTLLGVLPGYLLGDYRYAHLAAVLFTAALLTLRTHRTTGPLAAALLLTHPRLPWILEWGWTEPLITLLLVLTLIAHTRNKLPWLAMGLFLASKQYLALLTPLVYFLRTSPSACSMGGPPMVGAKHQSLQAEDKNHGRAAQATGSRKPLDLVGPFLSLLTALLITLPLALWNFPAFYHSAVTLQFAQPFRPDALSIPAMLFDIFSFRTPNWLPLLLTFLVSALLALRAPKTPTFLAWSLAITLPLLFALSKQAFANYYYLVAVAWCAALAFTPPHSTSEPHTPESPPAPPSPPPAAPSRSSSR
jgi:hypothetical protein